MCASGVPSAHFCGCSGLHLEAVGQNPTISPNQNLVIETSKNSKEEEIHSVQVGLGSDFETEVYDPKLRPTGLQPGPYLSVLVHHFHVSALLESLGKVL